MDESRDFARDSSKAGGRRPPGGPPPTSGACTGGYVIRTGGYVTKRRYRTGGYVTRTGGYVTANQKLPRCESDVSKMGGASLSIYCAHIPVGSRYTQGGPGGCTGTADNRPLGAVNRRLAERGNLGPAEPRRGK
uniref:Uncharacterized protein n=1 Tax=Chicken anemia virus (isolate USA 26p4) TaxID=73477 RepID=O90704_CAV26|nr:hypothetical protein [Chicken anemia virus]